MFIVLERVSEGEREQAPILSKYLGLSTGRCSVRVCRWYSVQGSIFLRELRLNTRLDVLGESHSLGTPRHAIPAPLSPPSRFSSFSLYTLFYLFSASFSIYLAPAMPLFADSLTRALALVLVAHIRFAIAMILILRYPLRFDETYLLRAWEPNTCSVKAVLNFLLLAQPALVQLTYTCMGMFL